MKKGKERSSFPSSPSRLSFFFFLEPVTKPAFQSPNFLDPKRQIQLGNHASISLGLGRGRSPKTQHLQGFEA